MAYEPTIWKDRVVEKPRTFNIVNNPDGTVTLVPAPGVVVEEGTPVNAANLNKLEQGLKTHEAEIASQEELGHIDLNTFKPWKKIDKIIVGTDTVKIDIIPNGFKEFKIIGRNVNSGTGATNNELRMLFNSDTTLNNYSNMKISNNSVQSANASYAHIGYIGSLTFGATVVIEIIVESKNILSTFSNRVEGNLISAAMGNNMWGNRSVEQLALISLVPSTGVIGVGSTFEIWGRE